MNTNPPPGETKRRQLWIGVAAGAAFLLLLVAAYVLGSWEPQPECVVEGAQISTPTGPRSIEDLRVGDPVVARGADGRTGRGRVTRINVHTAPEHLELRWSGGETLRVTSSHPIGTPSGWLPAGALQVGDRTFREGGDEVTLESAEIVTTSVRVFDLTVEPQATFFAEGLLVHNKSPIEEGPPPTAVVADHVVRLDTGAIEGTIPGAGGAPAVYQGPRRSLRLGDLLVDEMGGVHTRIAMRNGTLTVAPWGISPWTRVLSAPESASWIADAERVYLADGAGLICLRRDTGKELWNAKQGPNGYATLCSVRNLLVAVDSAAEAPAGGRRLLGRERSDGRPSPALKLTLPTDFLPEAIGDAYGSEAFFLRGATESGGKPRSLVYVVNDSTWTCDLVDDVNERIGAAALGGLILTDRRLASFETHPDAGSARKASWEDTSFFAADPRGAMIVRSFGDRKSDDGLALAYSTTADGGVAVQRFGVADGAVRWRHSCAPLGVNSGATHWQQVYPTRLDRNGTIAVVSQSASGHFVEVLNANTGETLNRWSWDATFRPLDQ